MNEQQSSKELLPCAHCGGAAQLTEVEPMHYVVECSEPMCNMSTRVYISAMDDSRPLAIEAWNRRVAVEPKADDLNIEEIIRKQRELSPGVSSRGTHFDPPRLAEPPPTLIPAPDLSEHIAWLREHIERLNALRDHLACGAVLAVNRKEGQ